MKKQSVNTSCVYNDGYVYYLGLREQDEGHTFLKRDDIMQEGDIVACWTVSGFAVTKFRKPLNPNEKVELYKCINGYSRDYFNQGKLKLIVWLALSEVNRILTQLNPIQSEVVAKFLAKIDEDYKEITGE
jgi:hypothetical protein